MIFWKWKDVEKGSQRWAGKEQELRYPRARFGGKSAEDIYTKRDRFALQITHAHGDADAKQTRARFMEGGRPFVQRVQCAPTACMIQPTGCKRTICRFLAAW